MVAVVVRVVSECAVAALADRAKRAVMVAGLAVVPTGFATGLPVAMGARGGVA